MFLRSMSMLPDPLLMSYATGQSQWYHQLPIEICQILSRGIMVAACSTASRLELILQAALGDDNS